MKLVYIVQASQVDSETSFQRNVKAFVSQEAADGFIDEAQPLTDVLVHPQEGHALDPDAYPGEQYSVQVLKVEG